ncbi:MAG: SDR family oxidoreductase [Alistipes sp.]|nr:SDR family oxidoreductase [Alistipes sp.]
MNGKVALVTASTRGIGFECAQRLAEAGAAVYLAVRDTARGRDAAQRIAASSGGRVDVVRFDAGDRDTFAAMIDETVDREGRIDVLVNNYGSTDVSVDLDVASTPAESFLAIVERNLLSVYAASQAAVKSMMRTGGGSIVNISSVGGVIPDVSRTAYGLAKASINFLTQQIAVQYAAHGIRCNAVLPGFTETAAVDNMSEGFRRTFLSCVPLGRVGTAGDIADAVLYLAGDRSSYVTGQLLAVAGGYGLASPMYPFYESLGGRG